MDNRYLYKAKRLDNGEWVKGLPNYDINGNITELEIYKGFANCEIVEIDPSTICQCTGLTDKNGKKIWENDIVKSTNSGIGIIKFGLYNSKHYGFYIKWVEDFDYREDIFYWCNNHFLTIDGNTLDNPELLEGGTE